MQISKKVYITRDDKYEIYIYYPYPDIKHIGKTLIADDAFDKNCKYIKAQCRNAYLKYQYFSMQGIDKIKIQENFIEFCLPKKEKIDKYIEIGKIKDDLEFWKN